MGKSCEKFCVQIFQEGGAQRRLGWGIIGLAGWLMLTCHNPSRSKPYDQNGQQIISRMVKSWSACAQHILRMVSIWTAHDHQNDQLKSRMLTCHNLSRSAIWSEWSAYDQYIIRAYDRHIDQHMISILISIWSEWWGMWRRRGNEPLVTSQRWVVFMGKYV